MKHFLKPTTLGLIALGLVAPSLAQAQYTGPGTNVEINSVKNALDHAVDDQEVTLEGYLIEKVGSEKYIFEDDSGKIRVELENEDFPNQSVNENTKLRITGEVEKDFMESPEIDVENIVVLD